eukprot:g4809.t1
MDKAIRRAHKHRKYDYFAPGGGSGTDKKERLEKHFFAEVATDVVYKKWDLGAKEQQEENASTHGGLKGANFKSEELQFVFKEDVCSLSEQYNKMNIDDENMSNVCSFDNIHGSFYNEMNVDDENKSNVCSLGCELEKERLASEKQRYELEIDNLRDSLEKLKSKYCGLRDRLYQSLDETPEDGFLEHCDTSQDSGQPGEPNDDETPGSTEEWGKTDERKMIPNERNKKKRKMHQDSGTHYIDYAYDYWI